MSHSPRWAVYLRISRTDDRLGVERQLDDCRLTLAAMGVADADIELFDENNTSATKGLDKRPEYLRLLGEIKAGRIGGMIVWAQDRGWRDPDELSAFLKLAESLGIRFATSSTGEANLDDPDTIHQIEVGVSAAKREVRMAGKRIARASKQRAESGRAHGRAPFGWRREVAISRGRVVDSWDELDEAEAGLIRHIVSGLFAGRSLRELTLEANLGDVKPRPYEFKNGRHAGRESVQEWSSQQLKAILLRESNAGLRRYKGAVLEGVVGEWPAIFDVQTYQRLAVMLKDPARRTNDAGSAPRYLLSGLAVCSVCEDGGRINVVTGGNKPGRRAAYTCVGKPGHKGCLQRHWIEDVDSFLGELVEARLADPAYAGSSPEAQLEIDELYARIDEIRAEQAEAGKLRKARKITLAQLVDLNAGYDEEIEALGNKIAGLRPQTEGEINLPDGWAGADLATKRAALRVMFAEIKLVPSRYFWRVRTAETIDEEVVATYR